MPATPATMTAQAALAALAALKALALAALMGACGTADQPTTTTTTTGPATPQQTPPPPPPNLDGPYPYDTLTEYQFFVGPLADQQPNHGVIPYTVAAPLWADQAGKGRFVVLPPGTHITARAPAPGPDEEDTLWDFPVGTVVIKNFYFNLDRRDEVSPGDSPTRIVETRLLILEQPAEAASRQPPSWVPYTYVWNASQTQAHLAIAGERLRIPFTNKNGEPDEQLYLVPNLDQCDSCHARNDQTELLGLVPHQLARAPAPDAEPGTELARLAAAGVFDPQAPELATPPATSLHPTVHTGAYEPTPPTPATPATVDNQARAYLHGNCAHCHRQGGGAYRTGLSFVAWETNPMALGICKIPAAAGSGAGGRSYDIVPGAPNESIVPYRMASTDPDIKMPELPNRQPDHEGVALIQAWIETLTPPGCD